MSYIPRDDHAAQLVDDQHVELRRRLTELLLQDLEDGLHHPGRVSQSHSHVAQCPDGVVRDQVGVPGGGGGGGGERGGGGGERNFRARL